MRLLIAFFSWRNLTLLLFLSLTFTFNVDAVAGSIPLPVQKAIARLHQVNSASVTYCHVDYSLMSSKVQRDTFSLKICNLQEPEKLRMVTEGDSTESSWGENVHTSIYFKSKKFWQDTIPQSSILDRLSWELYSPLFNKGITLEQNFDSNVTLRSFDTVVGSRLLHGYAFTFPVDDPTDTMIGPTTKTYVVDDDSNILSYFSSGIAFHRWIGNGVELIKAAYNTISESSVDFAIQSMNQTIQTEHFAAVPHRSENSYASKLPQPGTIVEIDGKTPDGRPICLDSIHSKLILLDFWYSGCGYCRYALPFLRSMQTKYRDTGLTVVGVDPYDDEQEIVQSVIRSESLTNPEMMIDKHLVDSLGVWIYPTFIFLDKNHHVISVSDGYRKENEPSFEASIEKNLAIAP